MKEILYTQHIHLNKYYLYGVRVDKRSFLPFFHSLSLLSNSFCKQSYCFCCALWNVSEVVRNFNVHHWSHTSSSFEMLVTIFYMCLFFVFSSSNHQSLCSMEEFRNLDRDIEGSAKRWKKFVESECPEKEKFPQEWKNKTSLQRLLMMRALRPDRMMYAVRWDVRSYLNLCSKACKGFYSSVLFDERVKVKHLDLMPIVWIDRAPVLTAAMFVSCWEVAAFTQSCRYN